MLTDLCVGFGGNPFTAYVAFTRVKGREHLFIYRPFDATPFQRGIGLGRDLLLRQLRGERIEWQALLAKYCEERPCAVCSERKQSNAFTAGQWKRSETDRVCRECVKRYSDAGTPWQCNVCKLWHAEANFPERHRQRQCSFYRVCLTCEVRKTCRKCGEAKSETELGRAAWKARHADRRVCRTCATKAWGHWTCSACREHCPRKEFSAWEAGRSSSRNDGTQRCNECVQRDLVCKIAQHAHARIARQRQRATKQRQEAILADVRALIAARRGETNASATGGPVRGQPGMQENGPTQSNAAANSTSMSEPTVARAEPTTREAEGKGALPGTVARHGPRASEGASATRERGTSHARSEAKPRPVSRKESGKKVQQSSATQPNGTGTGSTTAGGTARYAYACPFCDGTINSSIETGRIDHRAICGNQFRVRNGSIIARSHKHICPQCGTQVWSTKATGRIRVTHQTPDGHPCTQHQWVTSAGGRACYTYTCPFCDNTINSSIETGCVNHRTMCGNQFRVRNGSIVARSHEQTCPKCGTQVWSTRATGRIRASHLTPEGHPCKQHEWVAK